ncbi:neuronal growth regulator 1-like isoform X2 [Festucalex cinctus]
MKTIMWLPLVLGTLQAAGELVHTKAGQRVVITCGLGNFATKLEWRHGKLLLFRVTGSTRMPHKGPKSNIASRASLRQETNLEIAAVEEGDAGEFTCLVDNMEKVHTLVVVSVSVDPTGDLWPGSVATLQCRVAGLAPNPRVQWSRPGDSRRWDGIARLDPVEASHAGTWQCVFKHEGAPYTEEMEIGIQNISVTTGSPSAEGSPSPIPSQVGHPKLGFWLVAIGGSLTVLLLLILVLILSCHIRRKKKRFLQMKNVRKATNGRQYCQCRCPTAAVAPRRTATTSKKKPPALPTR